jgi:hypothetical protein
MGYDSQIANDFDENLAYLINAKPQTQLIFYHKMAAIVGSLYFLADLAEKNGFLELFNRLVENANISKKNIQDQFQANWVHNGQSVNKMDLAFLCDVTAGYNAAFAKYKSKYSGAKIPEKIAPGTCPPSPNVNKSINKLIGKLAED